MPPTELQTFAAQHALDEAGIEITGLSNSERRKVQKILSDAAYNGWTATKTAARIKQVIGLSPRQQNAVNAHRKAQIEAGRTPRQADSSASAYARRLRSARAAVVADYEVRTSLADAQRRVWAQDQHDGKISSRAVRVFKTHKDERTCKTCRPLNGKRQSLRSSKNTPPLHPNCRCTEVLLDEGIVKGAIVYDEKEIVAKVRRVRTMDGVRHYNLPIGSPIVAKPDAPVSFDHIGATWRDDAKMKKARAEFDALPDDAWVTVFHGTTPERAKALVAAGKVSVPKGYKSDLPTKATDALYIAPTVADAKNYGDAVVEMRVRKRDMKPSPEARNATLATAFFNSFDGAILSSDQTFTAPVVKGIRRVRTVEGARRYGRPIGSPILPGEDGIAVAGRIKPKKPKGKTFGFGDLVSVESDDKDFSEYIVPPTTSFGADHKALAKAYGVDAVEIELSVANDDSWSHRLTIKDPRYDSQLGMVDWDGRNNNYVFTPSDPGSAAGEDASIQFASKLAVGLGIGKPAKKTPQSNVPDAYNAVELYSENERTWTFRLFQGFVTVDPRLVQTFGTDGLQLHLVVSKDGSNYYTLRIADEFGDPMSSVSWYSDGVFHDDRRWRTNAGSGYDTPEHNAAAIRAAVGVADYFQTMPKAFDETDQRAERRRLAEERLKADDAKKKKRGKLEIEEINGRKHITEAGLEELKRVFGYADVETGSSAVVVTAEYKNYNETLEVRGRIINSDGGSAGSFTRSFNIATGLVEHQYFEQTSGYQGQGFMQRWFNQCLKGYKDNGFERVYVHANIDVGGYAWARKGFEWNSMSPKVSVLLTKISNDEDAPLWLRTQVNDILERKALGEPVSAREIADLGKAEWLDGDHWHPTVDANGLFYEQFVPLTAEDRAAGRKYSGNSWATEWHIGKAILLGSDWYGYLPLLDTAVEKARAKVKPTGDALFAIHTAWVEKLYDERRGRLFRPPPVGKKDYSDYAEHHLDVEASAADELLLDQMISAYRKPRKKPVNKLGDDFVHKHLLAKGQPDSADVYTPAPLPAKGMKPKPKKRKKGKKK